MQFGNKKNFVKLGEFQWNNKTCKAYVDKEYYCPDIYIKMPESAMGGIFSGFACEVTYAFAKTLNREVLKPIGYKGTINTIGRGNLMDQTNTYLVMQAGHESLNKVLKQLGCVDLDELEELLV